MIKAWRRDYNEGRPHMALNGRSPAEFARMTSSCEEGSVQMAVGF
jgi:putative transposase